MKTTIEIPDPLFRKAKAAAVARGQTFKQFMNEAVRDKLSEPEEKGKQGWEKVFGSLKEHSAELRRIDAYVEKHFERIDPEAWE